MEEKYHMKKLRQRADNALLKLIHSRSGDQMTGWLIVVLLVVVTGAVFLVLYQDSVKEIWTGIINKAKTVFGI